MTVATVKSDGLRGPPAFPKKRVLIQKEDSEAHKVGFVFMKDLVNTDAYLVNLIPGHLCGNQ